MPRSNVLRELDKFSAREPQAAAIRPGLHFERVERHPRWTEDRDVIPSRRPTYYLDLPAGTMFPRQDEAAAVIFEHPDGAGPYLVQMRFGRFLDGDEPDGTFSDLDEAFNAAEREVVRLVGAAPPADLQFITTAREDVRQLEPNVFAVDEPEATVFTVAGRRFIPSGERFQTLEEAKRTRDSLNRGERTLFPGATILAVVLDLGPRAGRLRYAVFISRRAGGFEARETALFPVAGPSPAAQLRALVDAPPRIKCGFDPARPVPSPRIRIRTVEDVGRVVRDLEDADREVIRALYLDTRSNLIGVHTVSVGSLDLAIATPREVMKAAILANASKFILVHNHPSGVLEPSQEDFALTQSLRAAGRVMGIPLVDFVIVGKGERPVSVPLGLEPTPAERAPPT